MKTKIILIFIISLLVLASCKKPSEVVHNGGSWTFKSQTFYTVTSISSAISNFSVVNTTYPYYYNGNGIEFNFHGPRPTADGSYAVSSNGGLNASNEVYLLLTYQGDELYGSTEDDSTSKVVFSVVNGKIHASGSNIMMRNIYNSDSARLTFDVFQP